MVDEASGYLFWYNIRDQSSQWMSDEDQAAYKAQVIVEPTVVQPKSKTNVKSFTSDGDATKKKKSMYH